MKANARPALTPEKIPTALTKRRQWVLWRFQKRDGKSTKVPYQPSGTLASSTDPDTWSDFDTVLAAADRFDGFGFVFDAADPFTGIDLDGCRDPETGAIAPWAQAIVDSFDTYVEVSPTGSGLKLFIVGIVPADFRNVWKLPGEQPMGGKTPGIEVYSCGRYFATTGWQVGAQAEPQERQPELESLLASHKKSKPPARPTRQTPITPDGQQVIKRASAYLAKVDPSIEGQYGHHKLFAAACVLVLGFDLSLDDAYPVLCEYNLRAVPEWDERELRRKLAEADKESGERGYLLNAERTPQQTFQRNGSPAMDDEPQFTNGHASLDSLNAELSGHDDDLDGTREPARKLPQVTLPGGSTSITQPARRIGELMSASGRFFSRATTIVRTILDDERERRLLPIKPATFCSDIETVCRPVKVVATKEGESIVPATCSETAARLLMGSDALVDALPKIVLLSPCPVLIERDGRLIQVVGYDRESGILADGTEAPDVPLAEAIERLKELFAEFKYATPGDHARAMASAITPAMGAGKLLDGRAPIEAVEADKSQTGKGYMRRLVAAIYRTTFRPVTQRNGGVGSMQESLDALLIGGAWMIGFDNFRGKLDFPGVESLATEDRYIARMPYHGPVEIDPRRLILAITTNRGDMTIDLANRSSITRLIKQPMGYRFRKYPKGNSHKHVLANQAAYLGAVFAVVKEWHRRGKPTLDDANHDFREWAQTLGWISENILGTGDLLAGHRAAQERISSPALNWLRDVCLTVQKSDRLGFWIRANQILQLVVEHGIETAGIDLTADLEDEAEFLKSSRKVGLKLSRLFADDTIKLEPFTVERLRSSDDSYRQVTEYRFSIEAAEANPS